MWFTNQMCGISGIFSRRSIDAENIISSLTAIKHRGPDDTFIVALENDSPHFFSCPLSSTAIKRQYAEPGPMLLNCWLGFNRLSVIDQTINGFQPLYDETRNCIFLMNGEVYNYRELRNTYLRDDVFLSETDTEVVFRLYLKLGDDFIHHLRGMFVIVVVHASDHTIKVWRDRMGIKPFFYTISDNQFIFSSEISGVFASGMLQPEFDFEKLGHQFYLGTSQSPYTIYKHLSTLEPASYLTVNTRSYEYTITPYWSLKFNPVPSNISAEEFYSDVQELADLSLEGVAQRDKALMLSGGLDSGLLAVLLGKRASDINAYCIFSDENQSFNELEFAKLNASNAGVLLEEHKIPDKVSETMAREFCLAEEEPNISPEPAYYLSLRAKNKKRILYNALGLDELFYGYGHHIKALKYARYQFFLDWVWEKAVPAGKRGKLKDIRKYGLAALPFVSRAVASWDDIRNLFADHQSYAWEHPLDVLLREARADFADFDACDLMKKISFLDIHYYISSHHSFRSDRPAMLNHIEMRFPYLDHLFIQKYFNIPGLEKGLSYKNNKPFLRSRIKNILHPEVFMMPKKGFDMPVESWLKNIDRFAVCKKLGDIASGAAINTFSKTPARQWLMFSLSEIHAHVVNSSDKIRVKGTL